MAFGYCLIPLLAAFIAILPQDVGNHAAHVVAERNLPVQMRDGVILRADVLRPAQAGKFPVLVYRTPYGKDAAEREYTAVRHAVERGYAVVIQDVRGRYRSDGEFGRMKTKGETATTQSSGPPGSRGRMARSAPSVCPTRARCSGSPLSRARLI